MKKLTKSIERVGIVANIGKTSSPSVVREAVRQIKRSGRAVVLDAATAALAELDVEASSDLAALTRRADVILVFGGDGTMLRVAREIDGVPTPLLGINIGGLGFLTDVSSTGLAAALKQLWKGDFTLDSRALIEATGRTATGRIRWLALNDFVISRGIVSRLIELEVRVNGEELTTYRCDGLIVSSPTGSTAYSLAAGGAVVSPNADVFTLTPICPHTLSNRSVIVSLASRIDVRVVSEKLETVLSGDGQNHASLNAGDVITVKRSKNSVRLVRLTGASFFQTLRHKLHWRGSNIVGR